MFTYLGRLLNWLPIIHVSRDSDFGSFEGKKIDVRLSILSLSLGQYKYYFCTVDKSVDGWKFRLYKRLDFYDICKICSQDEIQVKVDKYILSLGNIEKEHSALYLELIKEKINQARNRVSNSYTKITGYRSILLAFVASGAYILTKLVGTQQFTYLSKLTILLLVVFALYSLSLFLQITFALKVKGFVKSTLKDLSKNKNQTQLIKSFYTDLASLNDEGQIIVSITKNAEKYFNRSFLVLITAWFCLFVDQNKFLYSFSPINKNSSTNYIIINNQGELQMRQLSALFDRLDSHKESIYIVSSGSSKYAKDLASFIELHVSEKQEIMHLELTEEIVIDNVVMIKLGSN